MTDASPVAVAPNASPPLRFYMKEWLKDQRNYHRFNLRMADYEFCLIHPVKCGGTFLKTILGKNFNLFCWDHEPKVMHFGPEHKLLFACRDPIDRFESAFYSPLHRDETIGQNRRDFYHRYPTVNHYVRMLSAHPVSTLRYAYLHNDLMGRFSKYSYWLGSQRAIKKHHHKIRYVFRTESLNHDIERFFSSLDLGKPDLSQQSRYARPSSKFESLDRKSRCFLSGFLRDEYELINCLLYHKGLPLYQIPHA
jgi:hypothetical protein